MEVSFLIRSFLLGGYLHRDRLHRANETLHLSLSVWRNITITIPSCFQISLDFLALDLAFNKELMVYV